jgi:hypothetical protein
MLHAYRFRLRASGWLRSASFRLLVAENHAEIKNH